MHDDSLDQWIGRLNDGDEQAVERVFQAYEPYLRIAVRRRLGRRLQAKVDSGDIVQSVFADVLGGFRAGNWHFSSQAQLLAFLRQVAWRRLSDRCQKHRNAMELEQPLGDTEGETLPDAATPRPSEVAQGREFWERLLTACPPAHQEIVRLRMSGYKLQEIATRTGLHEGSVRRILYDLARKLAVQRRSVSQPAGNHDHDPEPDSLEGEGDHGGPA